MTLSVNGNFFISCLGPEQIHDRTESIAETVSPEVQHRNKTRVAVIVLHPRIFAKLRGQIVKPIQEPRFLLRTSIRVLESKESHQSTKGLATFLPQRTRAPKQNKKSNKARRRGISQYRTSNEHQPVFIPAIQLSMSRYLLALLPVLFLGFLQREQQTKKLRQQVTHAQI